MTERCHENGTSASIEVAIDDRAGSRRVRLEYLFDTVARLARESGNAPAMTFVDYRLRRDGGGAGSPAGDGGGAGRGAGRRESVATTMTYAELDRRARALAGRLQQACGPDARVAVLCPHEPAYVVAFLACLYAGVVAVPLYAPELVRDHARLQAVLQDCAPEAILTTSGARGSVLRTLQGFGQSPDVLIDADKVDVADESPSWRRPDVSPESVAYLQYTSGSTGTPAGVRITHANLSVANHQIRTHFPQSTVTASWVPFFHDFGLVCGILNPLSAGSHSVHISPLAFVQDPYRWLRAISDHRADWSITPSFGLAQCVSRVTEEQKRTLELRSLRLLTVAAEAVPAESIEDFVAAFAPCGLARSTPTPCYGLAEATLPVTAPPVGEGMVDRHFDRSGLTAGRAEARSATDPDTVRLVACGSPRIGVEVRIVDPETRRPRADGRVGEIWVRGPNVADGYWQRPDRTEEVFAGRIAGAGPDETLPDDSAGAWLRTGDLGFVHDGRLYITGRAKDVVIVRGRNHYPDDIEATVRRAWQDGRPGLAAAFSVAATNARPAGSGERLVVLLEADPPGPDIVDRLRREVTRQHGVDVHDLVLVRRGRLPRTTSGKIRRGECREWYLRGEFNR